MKYWPQLKCILALEFVQISEFKYLRINVHVLSNIYTPSTICIEVLFDCILGLSENGSYR